MKEKLTDWPHSPAHRLEETGAYMVTAGLYQKRRLLNTRDRLDLVLNHLFQCALEFEWELEAWAVLPNHYHFVSLSPEDPHTLTRMINKLHSRTSRILNSWDATPGRKVWHQYWDTHITYQRSFLARLNYVHQNPVHHALAKVASAYPWCSAPWFERTANPAFYKTVTSFRFDKVRVMDDF